MSSGPSARDELHVPGSSELHLAVALDGAGWHPGAWRAPDARAAELFTARYWTDLVQEAEAGLLDFVTIEDALGMQSSKRDGGDDRTDQVRGRLDAVLVASRVAPTTRALGLVPTATTTHTEPFHVSKAIATLDFVSHGRAGWRAQISSRPDEVGHFGRRSLASQPSGTGGATTQPVAWELLEEAADFVEVVRRLWDSWEDGAEIRDVETGRFVDVEKLHAVDFEGRWFRVRGPSITPRSPQGQPLVVMLAHGSEVYRLAALGADVVFVTPHEHAEARSLVEAVREQEATIGRPERLRIFGDLAVVVDASPSVAVGRRDRMDELDGEPWRSDAEIFTGSVTALADLIEHWVGVGLDGFRLRPATLPHDLSVITAGLVPELQRRGLFRRGYGERELRARLGLIRPKSRYAA